MSKRVWLLGLAVLVSIGLLVACGSSYNSSSDGLLLVGSQGSSVIETFSFTLNNGHISTIANSPNDTANQTCLLSGSPSSMVIQPSGNYAYVIMNPNSCSGSKTGIAAFNVKSDGTIQQIGSLVPDPNPVALAMDSAGKSLFVAEGAQGLANVYAVGSGGSLTLVKGTFNFVNGPGFQTPNIVALAASPTVFPGIGVNGVQNAVCSTPGSTPPTSEYLYAVDSVNYVVWEFSVNTSSGALGNPPSATAVPYFVTDQIPAGVAVDPCDRFVYVSDSLTNKVSGYQLCVTVLEPACPLGNGSLVPVSGSPFALAGSANGPGPIVVDPYGHNVYVVGTLSNTVSVLTIVPVSGALAPFTTPTIATGSGPVSIAIRADDNWLFVANYGTGAQGGSTVSQYSITPATGALTVLPAIQTDNYPWGVAVK